MSITKYFKGSIFHTPTDGVLEYLEDVLICVDAEGMIKRVVTTEQSDYPEMLAAAKQGMLVELQKGQYFYRDSSTCTFMHPNGRKQELHWMSR